MKGVLTKLIVSALVIFISLSVAAAADFDFAAYKSATLDDITTRHINKECKSNELQESTYSAYAFKYKVIATFSRKLRPLSEDTKKFLNNYAKALPSSRNLMETYKNEFLVQDNGKEYWIPVQEPLIPAMGQELKEGQRFELYLAVIGGTSNRCVFIATEFNAKP
jgi:hypothetical protein